jgi:hypothetical protein
VAVIASTGFPVRTGAQAWSTRCLAAGTGVTIAEACGQAGNITVSLDTAVVNTFSSGTGDVPGTGAVGTSYAETDALSMYDYPATDTEHWRLTIAAGQTAGRLFQTSATDVLAEITPTDETVLVSNGTTWEKKTLPDCDDTGGNHLNYDTGTNVFSCGTGSFDYTTGVDIVEDFLGGEGAVAGTTGTHGWYPEAVVSGTCAYTPGQASHPGLIRFASHVTNDNSGCAMSLKQSSNDDTSINFITLNVGTTLLDIYFKPGSNGTAITNVALSIGYSYEASDMGGSSDRMVRIRYDTDSSDAVYKFQICDDVGAAGCAAAGDDTNSTVVDSTVTPTAAWTRFRILFDLTGPGSTRKVSMRVNSEAYKTFCSSGCDDDLADLDTTADRGAPSVLYLTRTTTGVLTGDIDLAAYQQTGMTRN